mgnify:CR=1 FL=1
MAIACVFLAAKVEETPRRAVDTLNVFYHIFQQRRGLHPRPLDLSSELYTQWQEQLQANEALLLKSIGFSMYNIMEHPHKFILYYTRVRSLVGAVSSQAGRPCVVLADLFLPFLLVWSLQSGPACVKRSSTTSVELSQ